jgi:hypothetical protein
METDELSQGVDDDPYDRCLAYIEDDQIALAERQARRIEAVAVRAIAQEQIRFVLEIKARIATGNEDQAKLLARCLIGGIKLKYETALGIRPVRRIRPLASPRRGGKEPSAGRAGCRPQLDLTGVPPGLQGIVEQLVQVIGRARAGDRRSDFSPSVLLELGRIAHRAWRRSSVGKPFSPLRADATEIRIVGACLRQRIEKDGGRLSGEDLSRKIGLSRARVGTAVRNLQLFLLQGSRWKMVGDAKTGFALVPEVPDI